jgi:hypothetical protein
MTAAIRSHCPRSRHHRQDRKGHAPLTNCPPTLGASRHCPVGRLPLRKGEVAVKGLVEHPRSGLTLDFGEDDFGGSDQAAIVAEWQARPGHRAQRGEFICVSHRNHEHPELYLRQRGSQLIAAHYPWSGLAATHAIVHGVSDEHRRQVHYLQGRGRLASVP